MEHRELHHHHHVNGALGLTLLATSAAPRSSAFWSGLVAVTGRSTTVLGLVLLAERPVTTDQTITMVDQCVEGHVDRLALLLG